MSRKLIILTLALALLGLIAGCSNNSTSSSNKQVQDIARQFGGFTPTNEQPFFGNPSIASQLSGDRSFNDPFSTPSDTIVNDTIPGDSSAGFFVFRIVWGQLTFNPQHTAVTDWDGNLALTRGKVILRRTINFESGQDQILPRTSPDTLAWISKTSVFHDGILVNVVVPPSTDTMPVLLSFNTAPFSFTVNLKNFTSVDTVYNLDDSNAVAVHAFRFKFGTCLKGITAGFWGPDSTGNGIFFGTWQSFEGSTMGTIRGTWGPMDSTGHRLNVFFGKVIDENGNFVALVRGTLHPKPVFSMGDERSMDDMNHVRGVFQGHMFDANAGIIGELRGRFRSAPHTTQMGFFHGHWKTLCPSMDEEDDSPHGEDDFDFDHFSFDGNHDGDHQADSTMFGDHSGPGED